MKGANTLTCLLICVSFLAGCGQSHEVVCKCDCFLEEVTFKPETGKKCEDYNGTECEQKDGSTHELDKCKTVVTPKKDDEGDK